MNTRINAPAGFEGCMYWNDGSRVYDVAFRQIGETWWTVCYLDAGHAYLTTEERTARAEAAIIHSLRIRGLIAKK